MLSGTKGQKRTLDLDEELDVNMGALSLEASADNKPPKALFTGKRRHAQIKSPRQLAGSDPSDAPYAALQYPWEIDIRKSEHLLNAERIKSHYKQYLITAETDSLFTLIENLSYTETIEMLAALEAFAGNLCIIDENLPAEALAALQSLVIPDHSFEAYMNKVHEDFSADRIHTRALPFPKVGNQSFMSYFELIRYLKDNTLSIFAADLREKLRTEISKKEPKDPAEDHGRGRRQRCF